MKEGQLRKLKHIVVTCHSTFSQLHRGLVLQISYLAIIAFLEGVALKQHGQVLPSNFPTQDFDGSKANKVYLMNRF